MVNEEKECNQIRWIAEDCEEKDGAARRIFKQKSNIIVVSMMDFSEP